MPRLVYIEHLQVWRPAYNFASPSSAQFTSRKVPTPLSASAVSSLRYAWRRFLHESTCDARRPRGSSQVAKSGGRDAPRPPPKKECAKLGWDRSSKARRQLPPVLRQISGLVVPVWKHRRPVCEERSASHRRISNVGAPTRHMTRHMAPRRHGTKELLTASGDDHPLIFTADLSCRVHERFAEEQR
eukprot:SAG11_NODE_1485_length_4822_cov_4.117298_3_plen_186_part_00